MRELAPRNMGSLKTFLRIALLFFAFILVANNIVSTYVGFFDIEAVEFSEEESEETSENFKEFDDEDEFFEEDLNYFLWNKSDILTKESQLYGWSNPDTEIKTPPPEQLIS